MKKSFISIFVLLFTCGFINAQIEKGTIFLGTSTSVAGSNYDMVTGTTNSIGFTFSSLDWSEYDEKEKYTVWNFSPKLGYFIADNFVLGVNIKLWTQNYDESKTSITAIGPYVRYYFTNGKIVPFAEGDITFGKYKETWDSDYSDGESKENLTIASLGAGLAFFVNDFISVDCMAGYKTMTMKESESNENGKATLNNFGLIIGFTATF